MTKLIQTTLVAAVLLLAGAPQLHAEEAVLKELFLGKPDAPVTLQEFASLTCSHCAEFTVDILPELEKKYIETGKLRYIYRDFPIDGVALKASALAHCMPAEQYYAFINVLSKNQQQWAMGKEPEKTLVQFAKLGGLAEDKAKACLKDSNMLDALVAARNEAQDKYDVNSTPTFIFNEGQDKIVGARKLEEYTVVIDRLLAAKK
jgi:protein-disulfide isomerase